MMDKSWIFIKNRALPQYLNGSDSSSDDGTNVGTDSDIGNDDASTFEMLHDLYRGIPTHSHEFDKNNESSCEEPNTEAKIFYRLLKDAEQKLYPDCDKFSKLSFEYADLYQCPKCGEKRWMVRKGEHTDEEVASENSNKRIKEF
ncbi:hypothetical protein A4A49_53743 [Nicotiana attenuata]|uniref:Transposase-associated domain-containing protein n=1 Tax=Nicotiana attenuata TaxID=49451 RepID=A0A1J6K9Y8_NICAT|nr:hypothetical protein A4A49_53743 [Nicotiana attenuata]